MQRLKQFASHSSDSFHEKPMRGNRTGNTSVLKNRCRLSRIEMLPVEIIEKIHIDALEPNFPRASIVIANAVSRETIYQIFMMHAFWNDPATFSPPAARVYNWWSPRSAVKNREHLSLPDWYHCLPLKEQCRLQVQVISCRWFTPHRLANVLRHAFHWTSQAIPDTSFDFTANSLFSPDLNLWPMNYSYMLPREDRGRFQIPFIRLFTISDKIICGPWDDDQVQLLKIFYCESLKMVHWRQAREIDLAVDQKKYIECIADTIKKKAHYPFLYLLGILANLHAARNMFDPARALNLPANLYRIAVRYHPTEPTFLWPLIQVDAESLPDEPAFYRWAIVLCHNNDICGQQTLRILKLKKKRRLNSLKFCHRGLDHVFLGLSHLWDSLANFLCHRRHWGDYFINN